MALIVLGFVLAGLAQAVRFGTRTWDMQQQALRSHGDADAVERVLRRVIEQADPGRDTVPAEITGTAATLSLVTDLSAAARGRPRQAQVALGVDGAHRLLLRWLPYLHAPRLQAPPPPEQSVLLNGVDRLMISYWGRDQQGARGWHDAWQGPDLPDLIRIGIVFPPGDARRWPPLVAAPMRSKPR